MFKYFLGIFIILIGVYFMLINFGIDIGLGVIINDYWPLILILIGLKFVIEGAIRFKTSINNGNHYKGKLFWGFLILLVGITFLGNNLSWFSVSIWNILWPLVIIFIGLEIVFEGLWRKRRIGHRHNYSSEHIDKDKHWFGEFKYGEGESWNLDDIKMWHGAGEVKIDLTKAIIPDREVFIDISGWAGEISIFVPHDLPINVYGEVRAGEVKIFDEKQDGIGVNLSFESEDYNQAQKKVNMSFSLTFGQVRVKRVY